MYGNILMMSVLYVWQYINSVSVCVSVVWRQCMYGNTLMVSVWYVW